ncbi:MAG: malto-oligosyltrehalose trehalohydrolase [Longimicrobiales bacterium]
MDIRVWAPRAGRLDVVVEATAPGTAPGTGAPCRAGAAFDPLDPSLRVQALESEPDGWFGGLVPDLGVGDRYWLAPDGEALFPDPASRWQPEGPHGPSAVVDPSAFRWRSIGWRGPVGRRHVIYELHPGTFTPEGTWYAATSHLRHLADLGITLIELMPVVEFAGEFGWGYDGVDLFAPRGRYGEPDAFRRFVDAAHGHGIGVVLDVVYNHFGPVGNYLPRFSDAYLSREHTTDWGAGINFDGPDSGPVREYFLANVRHWIEEYRLDGLRLDATQDIHDRSEEHIITAIGRVARAAARERSVWIVAENEPQRAALVRPPEQGGFGLDALWNDDFQRAAVVALTGRREAYYTDYLGGAAELLAASRWGFLYQGQRFSWQDQRRGTAALDLPPEAFVAFIENHDQVANSDRGLRLHQLADAGAYRAVTALLLLGPANPMLFQGQEFASTKPFLYFADHEPELAADVRRGRAEFLMQFPSYATERVQRRLPDPCARETYERCVLDWRERDLNAEALALHRDLLALRRTDPVLSGAERAAAHSGVARPDGAVLAPDAFLLRWFAGGEDRLLIVNLGRELSLVPCPEPLLAPPDARRWAVRWSSEDPSYGGRGVAPPVTADVGWQVPAHSATLLVPEENGR